MYSSIKHKILISVIDDDIGEILSQYESEDFEGLDAFDLKKLLENVCEGIILEYKRDIQRAEEEARGPLQIIKLASVKTS
jgi:hypothetical protein